VPLSTIDHGVQHAIVERRMTCTYCGSDNAARANYCRNCGILLELPPGQRLGGAQVQEPTIRTAHPGFGSSPVEAAPPVDAELRPREGARPAAPMQPTTRMALALGSLIVGFIASFLLVHAVL
jgi:hypothetical protein